ncbi:unnamed protein product [Boreogadus saida]
MVIWEARYGEDYAGEPPSGEAVERRLTPRHDTVPTSGLLSAFLVVLARRENTRECFFSVLPSAGGSRVDRDLPVGLVRLLDFLADVSRMTASAGGPKVSWARAEPRVVLTCRDGLVIWVSEMGLLELRVRAIVALGDLWICIGQSTT